jgi:sec-independent protein translocase protein TatB
MFDIGASELLVIIVVAILVIGPKDMPRALRMAGRWIGKVRRVSSHFRTGLDAMIREAELEDMEKQWKAQNAAIMAGSPVADGEATTGEAATAEPENLLPTEPENAASTSRAPSSDSAEPQLPLGQSTKQD